LVTIKSKKEIEQMKEACKLTAQVHEKIKEYIKPGISTYELDQIAEKFIRDNGGIPSEKNYPSGIPGVPDFPGSICASINDEIIHGIPSTKAILKEGDIVSFDITAYKNGFHGDAARTHIVGEGSNEAKKLVDITKKAFFEGIKFAKPGFRIGDISHAIGEFIEKNRFYVVLAIV